MSKIKIKAPATIANLSCGYDLLGLAINDPGDVIEAELNNSGKIIIKSITGFNNLSKDPDKNVVGKVLQAVQKKMNLKYGFSIKLHKGINQGSGIGSSAASSAAAAVAAHHLLGKPFTDNELVDLAMEGELLASGEKHADNVAPSILGGITLIRSYNPLDIIRLEAPSNLYCIVFHPHTELKTSESRAVVPKQIPVKTAIAQCGNLASFVSGILQSDYNQISKSLQDFIAEPYRASLVPAFNEVKNAAIKSGALGAGISGSGPSVYALCKSKRDIENVRDSMKHVYVNNNIKYDVFISKVNQKGCEIV